MTRVEQTREPANYDLLLSMLGHDLQAPLRNIKLALWDTRIRDACPETLDALTNNTRQLESVLSSVLRLSHDLQTDTGGECDLKEVILRVRQDLHPFPQDVHVKSSCEGCAVCSNKLYISEDMARYILRNLVENSIKFRCKGEALKIDIKIDHFPNTDLIWYEDTACGMSSDTAKHLFVPFRRGNSDAPGYGLGLFVCKALLNRINGDIKLYRTKQGSTDHGSLFVITTPTEVHSGSTHVRSG